MEKILISNPMKFTGEREIPSVPGTTKGIDTKHVERYKWASSYSRGKLVYDVACGTGYGSMLLETRRYVGFDYSADAISYAKKYYGKKRLILFKLADASFMPTKIKTADVIVSFETIEHLYRPEEFLKWCSKHGKILLISTPIRSSVKQSGFHIFEHNFIEFEKALRKYFSKVTMHIQKDNIGIVYSSLPIDKGVAVAVCQS